MPSRSTFGETLLAAVGLVGFIVLLDRGHMRTTLDVWMYLKALGVIVAFYALLLLVRALFTFIAGGDGFWWEKYEERDRKNHK